MVTAVVPKPQSRQHWTFDEMAEAVPETNAPTELWDGEIILSPAPTPSHQETVFSFATLLSGFVRRNKLGKVFISPIDVVLSPRRAVQPDVIYVAQAHIAIVRDAIRGVPDLVVEVVSAGTWKRDRVDKKGLYEQFGVAEYWVIDPEARRIEVFVLTARGYELHCRAGVNDTAESKLLAGFSVDWAQLENS